MSFWTTNGRAAFKRELDKAIERVKQKRVKVQKPWPRRWHHRAKYYEL